MLKTGNSDAFFREKRLTKNIWVPARVEMSEDWYLVGLPGLKLDGLEVRQR